MFPKPSQLNNYFGRSRPEVVKSMIRCMGEAVRAWAWSDQQSDAWAVGLGPNSCLGAGGLPAPWQHSIRMRPRVDGIHTKKNSIEELLRHKCVSKYVWKQLLSHR